MGQIDAYQIIGNHKPIIDAEEETKYRKDSDSFKSKQ